jgi:hypothetical protein
MLMVLQPVAVTTVVASTGLSPLSVLCSATKESLEPFLCSWNKDRSNLRSVSLGPGMPRPRLPQLSSPSHHTLTARDPEPLGLVAFVLG